MSPVELAESILALCLERNITIAGAESCTGGLVSSHLTRCAGASHCFLGSVVCYTKMVKQQLLQVPQTFLDQHGAVSHHVTTALLEGVLNQFDCDVAFAVTGFAGPKGAHDNYPVGTVFIGIQAKKVPFSLQEFHFDGDRQAVIQQAAVKVLEELKEYIQQMKLP